MSRFAEALDIFGELPEDQQDTEAERERLLVLAEGAGTFLRGGGRLSLTEWCTLTPQERAVFATMGEKLAVKHAVQIATAARTLMGQAAVMAVIDDGDQMIRLHLTSLLDRLERKK